MRYLKLLKLSEANKGTGKNYLSHAVGSKVRVAGKGEPGFNGGRAGDLYLIIHLNSHPFLTRKGDNLTMEVPVTVNMIAPRACPGPITFPLAQMT